MSQLKRESCEMEDKAKIMVLASFVGDSLALGVHWIYDVRRIEKQYGRVDTFLKPAPGSYHAPKDKGEFTHYGDQAFVLLESVAFKGGFDPEDFSFRWQHLFKDYSGYFDQATKTTLENLSLGKSPQEAGSSSNELAGASRIAPLVFCYREALDYLVEAARTQTSMTHNDAEVIDGAEFFSRVCWRVLKGASPLSAMKDVARERFEKSRLSEWVQQGIQSKKDETAPTIMRFGQTCHVDEAFAAVVHLIAKYEENLEEALIQSVMAGGDSAGRCLMVGMVLGAYLGSEGLPMAWLSDLKKGKTISDLLEQIG
jgi:ADP-ribosylglycohydrolase